MDVYGVGLVCWATARHSDRSASQTFERNLFSIIRCSKDPFTHARPGPAIYDTTPIFPSLSYNTVIVQQPCRIQDNDALLGDVRGIARGLMEVCRRALERCTLQSREGVNVQRR